MCAMFSRLGNVELEQKTQTPLGRRGLFKKNSEKLVWKQRKILKTPSVSLSQPGLANPSCFSQHLLGINSQLRKWDLQTAAVFSYSSTSECWASQGL